MAGGAGIVPTESKPAVAPHQIFAGSCGEIVVYRVRVPQDKFNLALFTEVTRIKLRENMLRSVTCSPFNQESDYHLHVTWILSDEFEMNVAFVKGSKEHASDEREPYAEQFMDWIGQFFVEKKSG